MNNLVNILRLKNPVLYILGLATIIIQIQRLAYSVVSDTNGLLIPGFGPWRHEERDTILKGLCQPYYANPTQCAVHLVMFKISVGRDPKNLIFQRSKSDSLFSKFSNSQDHIFRACRHPHSNLISCLVVYYDKWWLLYPLCMSINCTNWLCTWTETRMVQSPTKLNDKI